MYYINFILVSIWVLFWIRNGYLADKYFWAKAWELERIRPRLIWGQHIDAPKWIKNKELRKRYIITRLRVSVFTIAIIWIQVLLGVFIESLYLGKEWPAHFIEIKMWIFNTIVFIVMILVRFK